MKSFLRETDEFFSQFMAPATRKLFYWVAVGFLIYSILNALGMGIELFRQIASRVFELKGSQAILQGNVWQFVTYLFAHSGFLHFFSNILMLFFFASMIEERMGSRRYLWFVFLAGIAGGVCHAVLGVLTGNGGIAVVGISGPCYAIMVAAVMWYPRMVINFFFFPVPLRVLAAFFGVLLVFDILGSIQAFGLFGGGVSHIAHVVGIAGGWLMIRYPVILDHAEDLRLPGMRRRPRPVRGRFGMGHPGRHSDPDDRYNDPHWYLDQ